MTLPSVPRYIQKKYNGEQILRDCSFSFSEHGIYVADRSKRLREIKLFSGYAALIEEPDSGEINYFSDGNIVGKTLELNGSITLVLPKVGVFNTTVFRMPPMD